MSFESRGKGFTWLLIGFLIGACIVVQCSKADAQESYNPATDKYLDADVRGFYQDLQRGETEHYYTWQGMKEEQRHFKYAHFYRFAVASTLLTLGGDPCFELGKMVSSDSQWEQNLVIWIDRHYADPANREGLVNNLFWVTKEYIKVDIKAKMNAILCEKYPDVDECK